MSRFVAPVQVEALRSEINEIVEPFQRQLYLNDFPHPSPYWAARGQTLRHYVIFMLKMGGDKKLVELRNQLQSLFYK